MISDLAPHPVSRFVYQFFAGSQKHNFAHKHVLVNTFDYGKESCKAWFEDLSNLSIVDVSLHEAEKRVAAIRDIGADIAIDLSGWTSNHFLAGFMARLAPIQVNYLGYFASSGLDEMDYWLGDCHLFPKPMLEWSSEQIFVKSSFLAEASYSSPGSRGKCIRRSKWPHQLSFIQPQDVGSDDRPVGQDSSGCA